MTPREKARELVSKCEICTRPLFGLHEYTREREYNKECALLIVDEILNNEKNTMRGLSEDLHDEYWYSVRQEIQKL